MRLALVRASAPAFGDRLVGSAEVPLSPEGQDRARAAAGLVAAKGEVSRVYSAPLGHALEAARLVSAALSNAPASNAPVTTRADLAEVHMGLWQGLSEGELSRRHKTAFRAFLVDARAVVPPEGEEVLAALARLGRGLAAIQRKHARDAKQVVVVAAELAFTLLVALAQDQDAPAELWSERTKGADVRFVDLG